QTIRVSLILYLVSILIHEITGINEYVSIFVGGIVTSFYTVLGGIRAVLWTDFIQAMVLWVGGLIALFVVVMHLPGGLGEIFRVAAEYNKFSLSDINPATGQLEPVPLGLSWDAFTKKTVL